MNVITRVSRVRCLYVLVTAALIAFSLLESQILQAGGQGGGGDDARDCCPLERADLYTQDGSWDPKAVIDESSGYNPFTADPNGPVSLTCAEPDCDEVRLPGKAAHSVSLFPLNQSPRSSGDDDIAGNVIEANYSFKLENLDYLPITIRLDLCMESSSHRGNSANSGGFHKGGEADPPRVDACFDREAMEEEGWEVLIDEQCEDINANGDRPQQMSNTITLDEDSDGSIDKAISILCFDSRMDSAVMVSASVLRQGGGGDDDDNDDDYDDGHGGGKSGSGYEDDDGGYSDDDDGSQTVGDDIKLNPVGRFVITDTDRDALWDDTEIRYNGVKPDADNQQMIYDSGFEVKFWVGGDQYVNPDPSLAMTVTGILDGLQDCERGFNEVADPNWDNGIVDRNHISLGDGLTAAVEQGGFVIRESPAHPDSGAQEPLSLWQMAETIQFENAQFPVKEHFGSVKKFFYRMENERLAKLVTPQFYDSNVEASLTEQLGIVPIRVLSKHYYPAPGDHDYENIKSKLFERLDDRVLGRFKKYQFGGSINFNSGPNYQHPFINDSNREELKLDPKFLPVVSCHFYSFNGAIDKYGATISFGGHDPLLTDIVLTLDDHEHGSLSLPVIFNNKAIQEVNRLSKAHIPGGELKNKYFNFFITAHELTHKLSRWSYHPEEVLLYGGKINYICDLLRRDDFPDSEMRFRYYQLPLDNPDDRYVADWLLCEIYDDQPVIEVNGMFFLMDHPSIINNITSLSTELSSTSERDGDSSDRRGVGFDFVTFISPNIWVDENSHIIPQGRYWLLRVQKTTLNFNFESVLYRSRQVMNLDMDSLGFLTDRFSVLMPENLSQDYIGRYTKFNLQRLEGPRGALILPID